MYPFQSQSNQIHSPCNNVLITIFFRGEYLLTLILLGVLAQSKSESFKNRLISYVLNDRCRTCIRSKHFSGTLATMAIKQNFKTQIGPKF
jgi:hypothetical protein